MSVEANQVVNFQIIGGSFFRPETMEPLAEALRSTERDAEQKQGDDVRRHAEVIRDLPTQDPMATPEDHARALANHLRGLGNVVLVAYSGGSSHVGRALEMLQEEDGRHPVRLVVSISGSLGMPPSRPGEDAEPPEPRNTREFREGIEEEPADFGQEKPRVRFNPLKALKVLFNRSRSIGHIAVPGMISQHRVEASPMPEELNTPWLYIYPTADRVRTLGSVLQTVLYYRRGRHKMDLRIMEGDHALPLAKPDKVGRLILEYCARLGIIPPLADTAAAFPAQRRAEHDAPLPATANY